ncbi:activating signal cointegrator 1 complex subunit 3 [Ceratobasidium sp. AG-Ba]|nr:activating signal cointegrator 1 complex subunit 3 [Ceratobasidium sp. AG-Ba]
MSQKIFPNSKRAIPKTTAERVEVEPGIQQPRADTKIQMEDLEDPPGQEMAKDARVWKTYVREADRWDKELVEGHNSSLDVLLSKAALFSAISTAFIIESLSDLKSDPAESSARSLLAISQKLDSIAAGQRLSSLPVQDNGLDGFSPSHSAVVVNILWLLSLSLSVAVSLIAMLSKDWCYKFMIGRSGAIYEQARRRQQKWNGIERWKLQELLNYLPGLMHIALLLFAIGLCIYLWDIDVRVAIPVTVVTSMAGCIYIFTTVLPFLDRFCPYSTPATSILGLLHYTAYRMVDYSYMGSYCPEWLEQYLMNLSIFLEPESRRNSNEEKEDPYADMDVTTSQMLAWMIVNCEDSRSVNTALQALAGARFKLPCTPLAKAGALELLYNRLSSFSVWDNVTKQYRLKDQHLLQTALTYSRSYNVLLCNEGYRNTLDFWEDLYERETAHFWVFGNYEDLIPQFQIHLLESAEDMSMSPGTILAATIGPALRTRWEHETITVPPRILEQANIILRRHAFNEGSDVEPWALVSFLELCAHIAVRLWPTQENPRESELPAILIRIFLKARDPAPELAYTVASILAATSFVVNSYPGGEQPAISDLNRERRAVQVLQHYYQVNQPHKIQADVLFMFGLFGLLPYINLAPLKRQPSVLAELGRIHNEYQHTVTRPDIHTLPGTYLWSSHRATSYRSFLNLIAGAADPCSMGSDLVLLYTSILPDRWRHEFFIPALLFVRYASSKELQTACVDLITSYSIASSFSELEVSLRSPEVLPRLLDSLRDTQNPTPTVTAFYFRLLVSVLVLTRDNYISRRQSGCKSIVDSFAEFKRLTPTVGDRSLPTEGRILDHLAESVMLPPEWGNMHQTMQIVVDFCYADPDRGSYDPLTEDAGNTPRWATKMQEIKDRFDAQVVGCSEKVPLNEIRPEVGNPCWSLSKDEHAPAKKNETST